jgi:hypothetical protein
MIAVVTAVLIIVLVVLSPDSVVVGLVQACDDAEWC